ncbi:hypothetical protein ES288_D12G022800v1 [Gossypium darwinii]|uniref:Uncharacterized protein n=1 Tax=Gossypium darwinii TaxID=34276 RepID=A0A5D2A6J0_GOSDA|nr:hypothetical protein ES288_D12G022800v1 [Gossypium darwinii]
MDRGCGDLLFGSGFVPIGALVVELLDFHTTLVPSAATLLSTLYSLLVPSATLRWFFALISALCFVLPSAATLLRNLPAGVLSYSSFEYLKAAVLRKTKQTNLEPIQSVCCGALAGAISASLTTPLDVVKTRLMTQVHGNKVTAAMYSGVNATVKQIFKEEGWIGLTSGLGPRVVHSACFSALGYFAFETARLAILHQYLEHKEKELSKINVAPA